MNFPYQLTAFDVLYTDNVELDAGSGGATIRTVDRAGVETPVSVLDVGGTSAEALIGDSGIAMPVGGLAAEDAAASGNPVPMGGRYDSSARTLDNGDRGEAALNASGQLLVEVGTAALPSGAATAANQTTIAGHLDGVETLLGTIDADTSTLAGAVSGSEMQVDVVSSTLPSGAASAANQATEITALQAIQTAVEGTVTVDGTVELGATALAALETITVASVTAPLAAGDNNIGNVDIASALPAGTNNIGDVDVLSLPATPAGTNLIGKVSAGQDSSNAYDGVTALTPKFVSIDTATSGDVTVIAAVTSKKIRVLAFSFIAVGTAVNVFFKDGAATMLFASSTRPIILDKTGATGPGGYNSGYCPVGWFETAAGQALILNLSAAQGVVGKIVYVEV